MTHAGGIEFHPALRAEAFHADRRIYGLTPVTLSQHDPNPHRLGR
jgi:hypothetical protein